MTDLSFYTLRRANSIRLPLFKNSKGEPAHSKTDGSDWSLGEWMNAILGELGETANLVKKIKRGDMSLEETRDELGNELADVITYSDITMLQMRLPMVEYWSSFNSLRAYSKAAANRRNPLSLGEIMNSALAGFGRSAGFIAVNSHGEDFRPGHAITSGFLQGIVAIDTAALFIGIDLGDATLRKFNAVSDRVGANVYIEGDVVKNLDGVPL